MVGVNCIVTGTEPPGGTVPVVGAAVYPAAPVPATAEIPVKVRTAVPLLAIVNMRVGDSPKFTSPNAMSPVTLIIRVGSGDDGAAGDDDEPVEDGDDPHAASRRETATTASLCVISVPLRAGERAAHEPFSLAHPAGRRLYTNARVAPGRSLWTSEPAIPLQTVG
jgi:hypothetical protein